MSGVDVLSVMDRARRTISAQSKLSDDVMAHLADDVIQARAAVAELIERHRELEVAAARLAVERAEFRRDREALHAALQTIMHMDVKGHRLQDRLQFSTPGRAILDQCAAALARCGVSP